ncbi:CdiA C-terminal domain-containing protein [Clostridium felsineum]|uniref:tRNA nuclease CdiA C-terminal domain-containing protein n=1 Tax=Clostridium felsineum TaxID=36839 RepID=A0A1S8L747_9CLOT|nr:hypothetical protein CLROS_025070 [Clostridium felsineum]URZ12203.1 hypothetical protein CROST_029200 [Clostridium felsineum]
MSYGILYRGDNREGLSKTTDKSAKIVDRKENLFEEAKDKAEDFLEFVSSKTKEIVDNAPSELEEAFKETEDFVSKAIDRLNKSLADFKYIAVSVATHPLLFMYGLSNSVVDNFTGDKTLQEAIKHNYEYRFETDKDYKSLTAIKAGETTGDVGSMAAGGALMEGGGAVDGAGYVFAVPTLGTVTVPAEAVGTTAIAAGGVILAKSSGKFGGDAGSVFKYADMGEREANMTEPSLPKGGKPKGEYATGKERGLAKQNETADLLAKDGYDISMLKEVQDEKGNGYGIKEGSNPDFLIENKPFDCYAPESTTGVNAICRNIAKKTKSQAKRIVLNLDDYPSGEVENVCNAILRKTNENVDLKRLQELFMVRNKKITRLFVR